MASTAVEDVTFTPDFVISGSTVTLEAATEAPSDGEVTELTFPECEELEVVDATILVLVDDAVVPEPVTGGTEPVADAPVRVVGGGTEEIDAAALEEAEDEDVSELLVGDLAPKPICT